MHLPGGYHYGLLMESGAWGDKQHVRFAVDVVIFRQSDRYCADHWHDHGHDPATFAGKGVGGGDVDFWDYLFPNGECFFVFSAVDAALRLFPRSGLL